MRKMRAALALLLSLALQAPALAQTVAGRVSLSGLPVSGAGASSAQGGGSVSFSASIPLRTPSSKGLPLLAAPKVQAKLPVAAAALPAGGEAPPLSSLYKENDAKGSTEESLPALIAEVKTTGGLAQGRAFEAGHGIMDRLLGLKVRRASEVELDPGRSVASAQAGLARPEVRARRGFSVPSAAVYGLGAVGLAGTVASVNPLLAVVVYAVMVIPSLILHEMAHAKVAEILGDPKQREAGRLSFSPQGLLTHFDLSRTLLMPAAALLGSHGGLVLGGAKELDIHYGYFKHPIRDMAKVALAGPAVHLGLALLAAAAYGLVLAAGVGGVAAAALSLFAYYNVQLGLVNLLPIYPADANHVLRAALHKLSPNAVAALDGFYARLGWFSRAPLWLAIGALTVTGALKAAALAAAGALLAHAAVSAAAFALGAALVLWLARRRFAFSHED